MYEYMLCWRRNDWVNEETESKYYLTQPVCSCLEYGHLVSSVPLLAPGHTFV